MLRLYCIPYSTNVERVALALGHKGLAAETVAVDSADRSPLRELSGQELVPVLVDDGAVVCDSVRIMRHLDERFPDRPLFPADRATRAGVDIFLDWFNRTWKREPNRITDALEAGTTTGADIERWGARMQSRLELFEGLLDRREYLFGDFGVADCAAWPFLRYAVTPVAADDVEVFHDVLYERMTLDERHPRLRAWIERVGERPRA